MIRRDVSILLLYDGEGKILLQQRSDTAKIAPGKWGFFGGGIEEDETPEQALFRELKEELDIVPVHPVKVCAIANEGQYPDSYLGTMHAFIARWNGEPLHQHEGKGWFSISDALDLNISSRDCDVLRLVQAQAPFS